MSPVANITICDLNATGVHEVRLVVAQGRSTQHEEWDWTMLVEKTVVLAHGQAKSRLAAQVAAQLAFEQWLNRGDRAKKTPWIGRYNWQ